MTTILLVLLAIYLIPTALLIGAGLYFMARYRDTSFLCTWIAISLIWPVLFILPPDDL